MTIVPTSALRRPAGPDLNRLPGAALLSAPRPSPRRHLGTFNGEGKRRAPTARPADPITNQVAGLAVTCALLIILAFVVGAL